MHTAGPELGAAQQAAGVGGPSGCHAGDATERWSRRYGPSGRGGPTVGGEEGSGAGSARGPTEPPRPRGDRKSTRLNSSHVAISYAVFCLKKKKKRKTIVNVPIAAYI